MALQSIESLILLTDCCPHVHLSADRGKRSASMFKDDVWSARRVP